MLTRHAAKGQEGPLGGQGCHRGPRDDCQEGAPWDLIISAAYSELDRCAECACRALTRRARSPWRRGRRTHPSSSCRSPLTGSRSTARSSPSAQLTRHSHRRPAPLLTVRRTTGTSQIAGAPSGQKGETVRIDGEEYLLSPDDAPSMADTTAGDLSEDDDEASNAPPASPSPAPVAATAPVAASTSANAARASFGEPAAESSAGDQAAILSAKLEKAKGKYKKAKERCVVLLLHGPGIRFTVSAQAQARQGRVGAAAEGAR